MSSAFNFGFGAPATAPAPKKEEEKDDGNELVEDEELAVTDGGAAKFAAVEVTSGEENYDPLCKIKAKIWRFDEGENQWKERGQGEARILRHKQSKNVMFILRREGTNKLAAQHQLVAGLKLKPNANSDKAFVWTSSLDFSDDDEEGHPETFAIRFATKELADEFKRVFDGVTGQAA